MVKLLMGFLFGIIAASVLAQPVSTLTPECRAQVAPMMFRYIDRHLEGDVTPSPPPLIPKLVNQDVLFMYQAGGSVCTQGATSNDVWCTFTADLYKLQRGQ